MEEEYDIYVDPEEDEVFFGCISKKEERYWAELVSEVSPKENNENKMVDSLELNVEDENKKKTLINDQSGMISKKINISEPLSLIAVNQHDNSVEMEHNYPTLMKPKIDMSILTTPKSIVKADRDGGFLKVLSEIALVKAEAEGDETMSQSEDEDKENRIIRQIPEIRVREATPEKIVLPSPCSNMNKQTHPFRTCIPVSEDAYNLKSHLDCEKDTESDCDKFLTDKRKSVNLIDLDETDNLEKEDAQENEKRSTGDQESVFFKLNNTEKSVCKTPQDVKITIPDVESSEIKTAEGLLFSKEARKIVEVLKKSAVDDFNFSIADVDFKNDETSFVVPEPSDFDKTEFLMEESEKPEPEPKALLSKAVEKNCHSVSPMLSHSKLEAFKHVSERRVYHQADNSMGTKKCVKKLPFEEKMSASVEKLKHIAPSYKIPSFGVKNTKIPVSNCILKPASAKMTTAKTPTSKTIPKNSKFNHIVSPINAYIHSKQTALVVNVKSEPKKNPATKIPSLQTIGSSKKPTQTKTQTRSIPVSEKPSKLQSSSTIRLPFVEYKSGTPYKIEKIPENRLPALGPSVQKLIGSQSPRVMKHEGRFYLTTPRKANAPAENSTVVADSNEVSIVVCQNAQKSNTIK